MTSNILVPVFTGQLQYQATLLCNARDLHAFLGVGRDFSNWIKSRIEEYGFIDGEDYILTVAKTGERQNVRRTDYHLTLNMAKELGMVERNDKGRQIRRYFIACEQAMTQPASPPPPPKNQIKTRDDLSFTKRDEEGRLINWSLSHDKGDLWGETYALGQRFMDEIAELAMHNEREAYLAIQFALSGQEFRHGAETHFSNSGWGQECGFVEAIARAAIDGLRRRSEGGIPFDPEKKARQGRKSLPRQKNIALPCQPANTPASLALH